MAHAVHYIYNIGRNIKGGIYICIQNFLIVDIWAYSSLYLFIYYNI